jgi:hypothetical protein
VHAGAGADRKGAAAVPSIDRMGSRHMLEIHKDRMAVVGRMEVNDVRASAGMASRVNRGGDPPLALVRGA